MVYNHASSNKIDQVKLPEYLKNVLKLKFYKRAEI